MELLEWLRNGVGCAFISDMRSDRNNKAAKQRLCSADLSEYSLAEIADAVRYLYDLNVRFPDKASIALFLQAQSKPK